MKSGTVVFAGAGPGAPDLLTLRCRDAIAAADEIVYAGSLVNPEVLGFARPDCRIHDSADMSLPEIVQVLGDAAREGKRVLRLHTGDPSLYGAIAEQMRALNAKGIPYEVIPGVSSVFACAAALKAELTLPGVSQTLILTRRAGRTPVPAGQDIASLAAHGATMAVFLSAGDLQTLVQELLTGGYPSETPAAVVFRASWPDERIVTGTLADIATKASEANIERQAIILVGGALRGEGEASRLYASDFFHGYRGPSVSHPASPAGYVAASLPPSTLDPSPSTSNRAPHTCFAGTIAVYALTEAGAQTAARLAVAVGGRLFLSRERTGETPNYAGEVVWFDGQDLANTVARNWRRFDGHVFVMASGIVVRKIAPFLTSKTADPAVVVCDERGRFAISLVGGHIAGANRLAHSVAGALGGQAVVTTATDVQGVTAFDELAARQGWRIENPDAIKALNSLLLQRKRIGVVLPEDIVHAVYGTRDHIVEVEPHTVPTDIEGLVVLGHSEFASPKGLPTLRLARPGVVLGIGCNRGTSADEIEGAVQSVLRDWHIDAPQICGVASIDLKEDEEGLLTFTQRHQWTCSFFSAERLNGVVVPNPSAAVRNATGTPSVAEAAAILSAGGRLLVPKQKHGGVTVAVAAKEASAVKKTGRITAVGIGPGTPEGMTLKAKNAILSADVVVGYKPYCAQIEWLIGNKRVIATGMRDEVSRCNAAIAEARDGQAVAVVCSGDAGVYGMAGLILELLSMHAESPVDVEVVPGVTSALEAAAALGAPLSNDYATVSLSDLLTPRETILARLRAVANCGMTCVLYNPRSRGRQDLFGEAARIFTEARGNGVPAGFVRHAGRSGQETWIGPLGDLPIERVDMSTVVILGGADTAVLGGRMVTRRGYEGVPCTP
jgi:cobalt-precorrin 5A hydrolase/precorrin-3B C17-methyltransferase